MTERGGMHGYMYSYYKNVSKTEYLIYAFVVITLAVFFILIQIFSLSKKKDRLLIWSYLAFGLFIALLTIWEEVKYIGKG